MTAQIANGGYKIEPRIILDSNEKEKFSDLDQFIADKKLFSDDVVSLYEFIAKFKYKSLFKNPENIKFVQDALFAATNEPMGTSYGSRLTKEEFVFAGKTGTSQVRRFTEKQRELEIKNEDLPYEQRDHALFVAFAPYKEPRYSISVVIEHGGSGSKSAAPIAKQVIKKVLENWLYWIVVDLAAVYLYFSRDLHLTALLFIVYTVIAIFGYISWSKSIKNAS